MNEDYQMFQKAQDFLKLEYSSICRRYNQETDPEKEDELEQEAKDIQKRINKMSNRINKILSSYNRVKRSSKYDNLVQNYRNHQMSEAICDYLCRR